MIPAGVIQVRSDICADCKTPCSPRPDPALPCSRCHINHWGAWSNCYPVIDVAAFEPVSVTTAAPTRGQISYRPSDGFVRRVRGYAAAGMLAPTPERHARRDACAACEFRADTPRRGLFRCSSPSARCGCVGGDELRLALNKTKCPVGKW